MDDTDRVSTGVPGLDQMLGGGMLRGDSTLVAGSPGTGKTTLGLQCIGAGVDAGEPGVFVTFEYLPQQLYRDAGRKGWDVRSWEDDDMARIVCTTPDVLLADAEDGETVLDELVAEIGAKRLVIDSMTHFEFGGIDDELRPRLSGLMNHLRMMDVTTIVTHEIPQIVGPELQISDWGLEFLVDNVFLLQYVELDTEMQKAINILKFRGGDHDRTYRPLRLTDKGMTVGTHFEGVENISSGTARRTVADRARDLV